MATYFGTSGRGPYPQNPGLDLVLAGGLCHGATHGHRFAVDDRQHAPAGPAEGGPQGARAEGRGDHVIQVGIGLAATRLVQPVLHGAGQ